MNRQIVFLSSVSKGMELYRTAVYRAIEGLEGYHCIRMEDFGALDAAPEVICREKVESGDIFLGILGHDYGSICLSTGKSFTETEYDTAAAVGKKRLMFLAPPDFPVQAALIETDERRELQRSFRQRVQADRHVAFFSNADDLGRLALQAVHNCKTDLAARQQVGVGNRTGKTRLLFPWVMTGGGFDTGITISNVSLTPGATMPQAGEAALYFYGKNAPDPNRIGVVSPGETFQVLASCLGIAFSGYVVAECNFFPARGYAVICDVGCRNVMSGYLAEVVDSRTQNRGNAA